MVVVFFFERIYDYSPENSTIFVFWCLNRFLKLTTKALVDEAGKSSDGAKIIGLGVFRR